MAIPTALKAMSPLLAIIGHTQDSGSSSSTPAASPSSMKKGGRVKKTGMAKVHKGEKVIPAGKKHHKKHGKHSSK